MYRLRGYLTYLEVTVLAYILTNTTDDGPHGVRCTTQDWLDLGGVTRLCVEIKVAVVSAECSASRLIRSDNVFPDTHM